MSILKFLGFDDMRLLAVSSVIAISAIAFITLAMMFLAPILR